ncbi:porin family protein [Apibacter raozihei]|uniref:porin family protein n=1 Tax=Apibacter raozihei TaxID=2500547 RepID=UPI000FE34A65|nr:porin family protein [Apibacter raozihei]
MKKKLTLLLLLSFFIGNSQIKLGVKAGINISSLYGDMSTNNAKAGVYGGVYARVQVAERFSIQPEVLFSMQGAESDDTWGWNYWHTDSYYDEKYVLNYITIPLMFQYRIIKGLRAEVGPQVNFALYKKHKIRNNYMYPESVRNQRDKNLRNFDVGINAGANYELKNGLNFTLRYNLGFINVNKSKSDYYYNYEIRNQVLSMGVGYSF